MRIALTAFTRRGAALAQGLARALEPEGHRCAPAFPARLAAELAIPCSYESLGLWTGERFADSDALIFVGAAGIAVRAIAPYVKDKFTDPAVVSVDEAGAFAVPLLSGHVGGANDLARQVAALIGATPVVTTATDVSGRFAVDAWAVKHGLAITDRTLAKAVSAALLAGERVGFASDFGHPCPSDLTGSPAELGVWVTDRAGGGPFPRTLRLIPRCLALGVGCRRGTGREAIEAAVAAALGEYDPAALAGVATIDLKAEEPGLLAFCRSRDLPLTVYTAGELRDVPGSFTPSDFVRSVTGVDNVCERSAVLLAGGPLVLPKFARDGVTVAAARIPIQTRREPI